MDPVQRDDGDGVGSRRKSVDREVPLAVPHRKLARDRADLVLRAGIGEIEGLDVGAEDGRPVVAAHDRSRNRSGGRREILRAGRKPPLRGLRIDRRVAGPIVQLRPPSVLFSPAPTSTLCWHGGP